MKAVLFQNEFGSLRVTPVTDFVPVRDIRKTNPHAMANTVDMETAEKIALITKNRKVQICFRYPLDGLAYLVLHDSPSTAAYCQVQIDNFSCEGAARDTIARLNRLNGFL